MKKSLSKLDKESIKNSKKSFISGTSDQDKVLLTPKSVESSVTISKNKNSNFFFHSTDQKQKIEDFDNYKNKKSNETNQHRLEKNFIKIDPITISIMSQATLEQKKDIFSLPTSELNIKNTSNSVSLKTASFHSNLISSNDNNLDMNMNNVNKSNPSKEMHEIKNVNVFTSTPKSSKTLFLNLKKSSSKKNVKNIVNKNINNYNNISNNKKENKSQYDSAYSSPVDQSFILNHACSSNKNVPYEYEKEIYHFGASESNNESFANSFGFALIDNNSINDNNIVKSSIINNNKSINSNFNNNKFFKNLLEYTTSKEQKLESTPKHSPFFPPLLPKNVDKLDKNINENYSFSRNKKDESLTCSSQDSSYYSSSSKSSFEKLEMNIYDNINIEDNNDNKSNIIEDSSILKDNSNIRNNKNKNTELDNSVNNNQTSNFFESDYHIENELDHFVDNNNNNNTNENIEDNHSEILVYSNRSEINIFKLLDFKILLEKIFSYLSINDLIRSSATNKKWKAIINNYINENSNLSTQKEFLVKKYYENKENMNSSERLNRTLTKPYQVLGTIQSACSSSTSTSSSSFSLPSHSSELFHKKRPFSDQYGIRRNSVQDFHKNVKCPSCSKPVGVSNLILTTCIKCNISFCIICRKTTHPEMFTCPNGQLSPRKVEKSERHNLSVGSISSKKNLKRL